MIVQSPIVAKSSPDLESLIEYCAEHPEQTFWEALEKFDGRWSMSEHATAEIKRLQNEIARMKVEREQMKRTYEAAIERLEREVVKLKNDVEP